MKTTNTILPNEFNAKIYNILKNNLSIKGGSIDRNLVTCKMIAKYEDVDNGGFFAEETILDIKNNHYSESELSDFFDRIDDFEVKKLNPSQGDYIITFGCPDAVYSLKIQLMYA